MKATTPQNPIKLAIKSAGGGLKLSVIWGLRHQTVYQWARRGAVPPEYAPELERLSGVSRKALRPNDWQRIWPELAA
jgi:DNA-binding transcriptional regulator YdaS (Cro superfamily)